jgi:mRNA-decapping enzyme subunit 2
MMQVLEETGCDVSKLLKLDDHIEVSIGQQRVRLYIITGVKEDTVFAPQTKKEISVCKFSKCFLIFLWLIFCVHL